MKALLFFSLLLIFSIQINSKTPSQRYQDACNEKKVEVFSDVDDTIKAAGTNFVAGCDTRWPGGSIYAGMPQFYLELSRGVKEIEDPINIGIVSARPEKLGNKFPDVEKELHAASKNSNLVENWGDIKKKYYLVKLKIIYIFMQKNDSKIMPKQNLKMLENIVKRVLIYVLFLLVIMDKVINLLVLKCYQKFQMLLLYLFIM